MIVLEQKGRVGPMPALYEHTVQNKWGCGQHLFVLMPFSGNARLALSGSEGRVTKKLLN
jgi:hypothetical protein